MVPATSRRVRLTEVTGILERRVRSAGVSERGRWIRMPERLDRPERLRRETWTGLSFIGLIKPHSAAALAWLRTAPSPQASTAAIQRASWLRPSWPTA